MQFRNCPGCRQRNSGFTVYQCEGCSGMFCIKSGWFTSDGCWDGNQCPRCGKKFTAPFIGSGGFREKGRIE